jgi:predicted transcriptional regulator
MNMELISITRKGVEKLINQLNELHEGLNASVEYKSHIVLHVAGKVYYTTSILEAITYLQGVKLGLEFMM